MSTNHKNTSIDRKVYICFGKTGAGKSTFIRALGGEVDLSELRDDGKSKTTNARSYRIPPQTSLDAPVSLIDGPGYDDTRTIVLRDRSTANDALYTDEENAVRLLRVMNCEAGKHFNGLFWFVSDNRSTPGLVKQAQFIDTLIHPHETSKPSWDRVVIMLMGNAIRATGALSAVEEVASAVAANQIKLAQVLIDCSTVNAQHGQPLAVSIKRLGDDDVELTSPTRDAIFRHFASHQPIKWTSRNDSCEKCSQTGDSRAFYPCHVEVKRVHQPFPRHNGHLFRVHGSRDAIEKLESQAKIAAQIGGTVLLATAAGVAAAATALAPNPVTASAAFHLTNLAIAAGTLKGAGITLQTLGSGAERSRKGIPESVLGERALSIDEANRLLEPFKQSITTKGKCSKCHGDAALSPGCLYLWTCCNQFSVVDEVQEEPHQSLGGGCQTVCAHCECKDVQSRGCIRHCTNCKRSDMEPGFGQNGCSGLRQEHSIRN